MRSATVKSLTVLACVGSCLLLWASSAAADKEFSNFDIQSVSASLSTKQAGAHADFTTNIELASTPTDPPKPWAYAREIEVSLPPGLIGNPQRFQRCTLADLGPRPEESECSQDAQVGVTEVALAGDINSTLIEPVYNMTSPGGEVVARFGFFAGPSPAVINVEVDPSDYSLVAKVEGISASAELISASTTLWGVPAADVHNPLRLTPLEAIDEKLPPGGRDSKQPEFPFLSNPTDCSLQREISVRAVSYQQPDVEVSKSAPYPTIFGCDKIEFKPTFTATPTNPEAFAPTGLDAVLNIPQNETTLGNATSTLKSALVSLPQGMTINPAAGDGLAACSANEVGFGTTDESNCPDAAKIGSAEVEVPALEHTLHGSVYRHRRRRQALPLLARDRRTGRAPEATG